MCVIKKFLFLLSPIFAIDFYKQQGKPSWALTQIEYRDCKQPGKAQRSRVLNICKNIKYKIFGCEYYN